MILLIVAFATSSLCQEMGRNVDPKADELLKAMSDYMKQIRTFRFHVRDVLNTPEDGEMVQYNHKREVAVSQPYRLKVDVKGDLTNRVIWKNENIITAWRRDTNEYVDIPVKATNEEFIDKLYEKFKINVPLSDFISDDVYAALIKNVKTGTYVGEETIESVECDHLAFTQDNIDWDIWIQKGEKPIFRKFLIKYKEMEGMPVYFAVVTYFKDLDNIEDSAFEADVPMEAIHRIYNPDSGKIE
jgi:hypothetical protein